VPRTSTNAPCLLCAAEPEELYCYRAVRRYAHLQTLHILSPLPQTVTAIMEGGGSSFTVSSFVTEPGAAAAVKEEVGESCTTLHDLLLCLSLLLSVGT